MNKYIVTITPPTPNGDLHLGHLSGPFLAADVCARVLKRQGHDVLLLSYSDDYQSYMRRKARQLRKDPFKLAKFNSRQIQLSLEAAGIEVDHFLQASDSAAFKRSAQKYFQHVRDSGQLLKKRTKVFHCKECDVYGYEGLGRGHCNWCGAPSDASQCEACAKSPDVEQMHAMQCMLCQQPMQATSVERWVWQIGTHYPVLREIYRGLPQRPALRAYLDEVLPQAGDEWALTRPGDAGLELEELPGQPLHTWFMGLAGYRATLDECLAQRPERGTLSQWWHRDTQLVHFLGFDCSYSHAVAYAALQTLDPDGPAPGVHLTNQFLKLDGEDFSTSRGHAVWIKDIAAQHPLDAIRLFTALHAPEHQVQNFDRQQFETWRGAVYERILQRFAADLSVFDPAAPADVPHLADIETEWSLAASLEAFSIAGMARAVLRLVARIEQLSGNARLHGWRKFAELVAPLCPELAEEFDCALDTLPALAEA